MCWRTGIGGDIAANLTAPLGTQIQGHGEAMRSHMAIQLLQDAPSLTHQCTTHLTHMNNLDKLTEEVRQTQNLLCYRIGGRLINNEAGVTSSKEMIRFMFVVVSTISSYRGTLPPTRPVLPPWKGQSASLERLSNHDTPPPDVNGAFQQKPHLRHNG